MIVAKCVCHVDIYKYNEDAHVESAFHFYFLQSLFMSRAEGVVHVCIGEPVVEHDII